MDGIPKDIEIELSYNGLLDRFNKLSPSHQNEYVKWISEAKKPETRLVRIKKMCEMIGQSTG